MPGDYGCVARSKCSPGVPSDMETLLLANEDVDANTPMAELVAAIRDAFVAYERGNAQMPAKSYIDLPQYNGDFRSMPAYLSTDEWDAAGIKW